jgi:hypothetical protein
MGEQGCIGKSTQSLEISLADCPDMGEGDIDGHGRFSGLASDTADRDDMLARGDILFGDEANVKRSIKAGEKALEHVLEALEMAASDGHPLRQIVYYVRRLETSQRLSVSWDGSFVESAHALLVFFGHSLILRLFGLHAGPSGSLKYLL